MYGMGRSEELVGEVVKELGQRQDVVIATKAAHQVTGDDMKLDNSPEFLKDARTCCFKANENRLYRPVLYSLSR